jgi:arginine decarboxylase-like protein
MAKGYAAHVGAAEQDLLRALNHIKRATQAGSRIDRGHHLGWAISMVESAARSLREADPLYAVLHKTAAPGKSAARPARSEQAEGEGQC